MSDIEMPLDQDNKVETSEEIVSKEIKVIADRIVEDFVVNGKTPVITEKQNKAPSGDPHDYASVTRYHMWRTENGGLDWDDGVPNPESEKYSDIKKVEEFKTKIFYVSTRAIEANAKGEDTKAYQGYINTALARWFVDDNTRMSPNLEYAQMINGEDTGQYFGIIEGTDFLLVLEQVEQLKEHGLIDESVLSGIKDWYSKYLVWLTTSEKGLKEKNMENNHGVFYDLQVAQIADFVEDKNNLIEESLQRTKQRIEKQIAPNGEMPLEAKRKDSYGYQLYLLDGYSRLASISKKHNIDLWEYTPIQGGGIKKAFEYFVKNLPEPEKSPIPEDRVGQIYLTLRSAGKAYENKEYFDLPKKYFPNSRIEDVLTEEMFR
jgi:hypothetical protein